jgi:hypothetical protein
VLVGLTKILLNETNNFADSLSIRFRQIAQLRAEIVVELDAIRLRRSSQ